jgi:hypothetical protein
MQALPVLRATMVSIVMLHEKPQHTDMHVSWGNPSPGHSCLYSMHVSTAGKVCLASTQQGNGSNLACIACTGMLCHSLAWWLGGMFCHSHAWWLQLCIKPNVICKLLTCCRASIAAGIGVSGSMQAVRVMCLKIIGTAQAGALGAADAASRAFDFAIRNNVDVINNS